MASALAAVSSTVMSALRRRPPSPALLVAAGLTQFGDACPCLRSRNPISAVGTGAFGLLHLITARKVAARREFSSAR